MTYRFRMIVVLCFAASGCGGDDGGDMTTSVGDGTAGTTSAATSTSMAMADTSGDSSSTGVTVGQTSSSSGGSDTTASGESTGSTDSTDSTGSTGSTGSAQTECGVEFCNSNTEICVGRADGGPSIIGCEPVPRGCEADRTCACVSTPLCTTGLMQCSDVADNNVFCDSGLD